MTLNFLIFCTVSILFIGAILTSSYNDDKTSGL